MHIDPDDEVATQTGEQFGGSLASINEPPGSDLSGQKFTVTGIDPIEAEIGGADVELTVSGTEFEDGAQITFNGEALDTTFVSPTELSATVPAAGATAGAVPVTVTQTGLVFGPAQTFTWTDPVEADDSDDDAPSGGRRRKRK